MLNKKIQDALNGQVNAELYSSYLYLSMSAHCSDIGLDGFANWMRVQAQEELSHAMKIYDFIVERGGKAIMAAIDAPPLEWKSPLDMVEEVLKHEQKVTGLINGLVDLAIQEKDHATNIFLQWFVTEQVEEEASVGDILNKVRLTGGKGNGMFMLDKELGMRVFTPPTQA